MGRSILSQLVNKSGKKSDGSDKNEKREGAMKIGPSRLAQQLNPLKADEWAIEKQDRQEVVKKQYFSDKRRLHVKERHARARVKAQLIRRKDEIDNYYRVRKLRDEDSRLERARRNARRRFERYEKKTERKHREQWQQSYRNLRSQRDKQYRSITKSMKKEFRKSRGLSDESQAPWDF